MKISTRLFAQALLAALTLLAVMAACAWQLAEVRHTLERAQASQSAVHQLTAAKAAALELAKADPVLPDTAAQLTRTAGQVTRALESVARAEPAAGKLLTPSMCASLTAPCALPPARRSMRWRFPTRFTACTCNRCCASWMP